METITISCLIIILVLLFLLIKQNQKIKELLNQISQKEEMITKIAKEIQNNKKKDKIICEQSKLNSMQELITNISHQYRQPLSIISVAASSVELYEKNGILKTDMVLDSCKIIIENVEYLSNIIENFSQFMKKRRNKEFFKIDEAIGIFLKLTELTIKTSNIKLISAIEDNILIYGYKYELVQILLNILNNSNEIFEKRKIKNRYLFINTESNEDNLTINIKDSAGGIDDEILDRIFEPYFTTKHQFQGVGLGLYVSYVIVEKMKGKIAAQNEVYSLENKNFKGVKFTITLPMK